MDGRRTYILNYDTRKYVLVYHMGEALHSFKEKMHTHSVNNYLKVRIYYIFQYRVTSTTCYVFVNISLNLGRIEKGDWNQILSI